MAEINMPKLSDTMEEGTVLSWMKQDGDTVRKGEPIAEIETDKASFEIEADADGVLQIVVEQGKPVPVGELIGRIGKEGEKPAGRQAKADGGDGQAAAAAPPRSEEAPEQGAEGEEPARVRAEDAAPTAAPEDQKSEEPEAEGVAESTADARPAGQEASRAETREPQRKAAPEPQRKEDGAGRGEGVKASPIARRLAQERGVDLSTLKGSGPEGRIVKEDVLAAGGRQAAQPAEPRREAPSRLAGPDVEVEELTRMQATVARRMTESKTTVPHFYVTVEARVDEAVKIRNQLKETVPNADRVTVTDMLVRACALALQKFPEVNASWVDGHLERKRAINIGIAVAQPKGLIVPVLHNADQKDLVAISIESRQLIERARAGKASQDDLRGGTFSISNLGMFGVDEFLAIINPPESAILAVGGISERPIVEEDHVVVGKVMRMTISVDHRVFYGATAAQFMAEVRRLLENPVSLVMPPSSD
jgi:pyruvate dehydrogenase E2 component (dihydrolipoamide acetyltransferase)